MQLKPVPTVNSIEPEVFKKEFYEPGIPLIIKDLSKSWPAYEKWNWDYFKLLVGDKRVPLYNNIKSDAYTPINKADDYKTFGEYIDMIRQGPAGWRIFLFNRCSLPEDRLQSLTCISTSTSRIFCILNSWERSACCCFHLMNNTNFTESLSKC